MSLDRFFRQTFTPGRPRRESDAGSLGMEIGRQYILSPEYLFANSLVFASQGYISPSSMRRAIESQGRDDDPSSRLMYGVQVGQTSHIIIGDGHHRICEDLYCGNSPSLTFDGWIPNLDLEQLAEICDCHPSSLTINTDIVRSRILQRAGYLGVETLVPFSDYYQRYSCMRANL